MKPIGVLIRHVNENCLDDKRGPLLTISSAVPRDIGLILKCVLQQKLMAIRHGRSRVRKLVGNDLLPSWRKPVAFLVYLMSRLRKIYHGPWDRRNVNNRLSYLVSIHTEAQNHAMTLF